MAGINEPYSALASVVSKDVLLRAFFIAVVLGSILTLVNQSDAILGNDTIQLLPLALVFLTPFVVVSVSQILGIRRATSDVQIGYTSARRDDTFLTTALSHGIPVRALVVALIVGTVTAFVSVFAAIIATGTMSELPTAQIWQALALPMLFGVVSQTISYRRTVMAMGQQL